MSSETLHGRGDHRVGGMQMRSRGSGTRCGGAIQLREDIVQRLRDVPLGIVRPHFGQIADVADVITLAVPIDVLPLHELTADGGDALERLEDRDAVPAAAAEVIDFSYTWAGKEGVDESSDVQRVNVVADLLALVAINPVKTSLDVALDEVAQEPV